MKIEQDVKLDFDDVLIKPKRSTLDSRKDVDLLREYRFLNSKTTWSGVPLIAANLDTTGTFAMGRAFAKFQAMTAIHRYYPAKDVAGFVKDGNEIGRYFITVGTTVNPLDLMEYSYSLPSDLFLCLDAANGYTINFIDALRRLREKFSRATIMAGNVATTEQTQELLIAGADIVKVGIGPGSVCTTRLKTGVGYPQLSAIAECADVAHGLDGHVCADGGCRWAGDVCKAFGAGADFVMVGGMISGTNECNGTWIEKNGQRFFRYYGMASNEAMNKYNGGAADYRAAEGKVVEVPAKGPVENVIKDILGGLRGACSLSGARRLKDFSKCCTFVRCNRIVNNIFKEYEV
jgi:GMP reductase